MENNDVVKNDVDVEMEKKVTKDDMLIDIIIRQTDYSKEVAAEKLIEHKYNILSIVREYMSSSNKKVASEAETASEAEAQAQVKSTSQLIYGEIRNMMGNASANYRRKKEFEEYRQNQIQAHLQKQIQAQQQQQQQQQIQAQQQQQEQK
jgi:hypothetical protein